MRRTTSKPIPWRDATAGLVNPIGERRLLTVIKSPEGPKVSTDVYWFPEHECFVDECGDPLDDAYVLLWAYLSDALPEIRS